MNNISFYFQFTITQAYNRFIFYLQRIPLLKKWISNRWYRGEDIKFFMKWIGAIFFFVSKAIRTLLFFLLVIGGVSTLTREFQLPISLDLEASFKIGLFALTIMIGTVAKGVIFSDDESGTEWTIPIKIFRIPLYQFLRSYLLFEDTTFTIIYGCLLSFIFAGKSIENPFLSAYGFTLFAVGMRRMMSWLLLFTVRTTHTLPFLIPNILLLVTCFLSVAISVLLCIGWIPYSFVHAFFSIYAGIIGILLYVLALYLLLHSKQVPRIAQRVLTFEGIKTHDAVSLDVETVKVKDTDYNVQIDTSSSVTSRKLTGIAFLNDLFYKRLHIYLRKKIILKLGIITGLILVAFIALWFYKSEFPTFDSDFLSVLFSISLIIGYTLFSGNHFTKFCFYHLDRKMMHYAFYRQPIHIFNSMKIRFLYLVRLHIPLFIVWITGLLLIIYTQIKTISHSLLMYIFLFELAVFVFFSLFYLIVYYCIQPFTESMQAKSPMYNVIHYCIYFISFNAKSIPVSETTLLWATVVMLLCTLVGGALTLYLAPKRFKLR